MRSTSRRAGFTLLEMLLAVSLLAVTIAIVQMLLGSSRRAYETSATSAGIELRARRAVEEIAALLQSSGVAVIPQSGAGPAVAFSVIDFQRPVGWVGGAVDWGAPERLALVMDAGELDDGLDNDGDELIDEKRVVRIEDFGLASQRTVRICKGVRDALAREIPGNAVDDNGNGLFDEQGLAFVFDGDRVTVLLTLEGRTADGTLLSRTARKTIAFRN